MCEESQLVCPICGTVLSLWNIANRTKIVEKYTSVRVCLPVSYKSAVCISLSKDVNTETKSSIIRLLFCLDVKGSALH